MKVAIHQPNYIPSFRYFYKISLVDCFIFLDDVKLSKGGFENRNKIIINGIPQWLTVPLTMANIKDCEYARDWKKRHKKTICYNYKSFPNFDLIYDIYCKSLEFRFSEMNIYFIKEVCKLLKFKTKFIRQSEFKTEGSKTDLLINILDKLEASYYVSNKAKYLEAEKFKIPIEYVNYKTDQPELSIIHDLMLH